MTVLIAAASKHGATDEIAARIGMRLIERGVDIEVKKLGQVADVSGYDAFVIGSGIYLGNWRKEARRFLDTHAAELAERPTWLFASGSIVGDPPSADDPNALRAGLADRLLEITHSRAQTLSRASSTRAHSACSRRLPFAALTRARATTATGRRSTTGQPPSRASSSGSRSAPALRRRKRGPHRALAD
jgi:flavodoxin